MTDFPFYAVQVSDPVLPDGEQRWPFNVVTKSRESTDTVFEEGSHVGLARRMNYGERVFTGAEIQLTGRGHVVVRLLQKGGDINLLAADWTVLGPDDTTLPTGEIVPTVRREIGRDFRSFPKIEPWAEVEVGLQVVGELRVVLCLLAKVTANDLYGPGSFRRLK